MFLIYVSGVDIILETLLNIMYSSKPCIYLLQTYSLSTPYCNAGQVCEFWWGSPFVYTGIIDCAFKKMNISLRLEMQIK